MEWRSADGQIERYATLASELVNLKVDAILAGGGDASVKAAQQATRSMPIILASSANAVADGLVKSLAKPEGNVTGVSLQSGDVAPKVIEILHTAMPRLSRLAVLVKPDGFARDAISTDELSSIRAAGRKLRIKLIELPTHTAEDIERVLSRIKPSKAQALFVMSGPFFNSQRERIAELALKAKLVTGFSQRNFVDAGGLLSYGPSIADAWALSANYVDKIFKGAKPGELPIQQPTRFYLHINRKTAKALGLAIPKELLLRADELID